MGLTMRAGALPEFTSSNRPRLVESAVELWSYRELFLFLAWRDVTIRYRQTMLGVAWAVLQPLATMAIFAFLFGTVVKVPTPGMPAPLFYLSALLPWIYFSTTVITAGNSLVGNAEVIKKVYFPRVVLPAAGALVGLVDFAIGAVILVGMTAFYGLLSWRLLLWLPLTALLWLFSFAVGAFLAALNVKYRDVKYATPFLLQVWLFLTPVIYPASAVPPRFQPLLALNPLGGIVEGFRAATSPAVRLEAPGFWVALALTAGALVGGLVYFRRAERAFSDIV
jgi:lipopolysaccharide transport system permease protein